MVAEESVRVPSKMVGDVYRGVIAVLGIGCFAAWSSPPQHCILLASLCCRTALVREANSAGAVLPLLSLRRLCAVCSSVFFQYL